LGTVTPTLFPSPFCFRSSFAFPPSRPADSQSDCAVRAADCAESESEFVHHCHWCRDVPPPRRSGGTSCGAKHAIRRMQRRTRREALQHMSCISMRPRRQTTCRIHTLSHVACLHSLLQLHQDAPTELRHAARVVATRSRVRRAQRARRRSSE
jgi:hypothetical protein